MSFDIKFDFRFDDSEFFNEAARAALEAAAGLWEEVIGDDFDDVPAGTEFTVSNPSGEGRRQVVLDEPIDDLRIFVGASSPPFGAPGGGNVIARGGPDGFDAEGDLFRSRIGIDFRDQGPVSDFEPFAGALSFDPTKAWSFDLENPVPGANDFVTVAAHEIGHVLGIGASGIFGQRATAAAFDGPNARAVNGGDPIPLAADQAHIEDGFADNTTLMDPSLITGTRLTPTEFDLALLADIGFEIDGFEAQGETPALATDGGETIFGTILADLIDAGGGNDEVQGNDGDDRLAGGLGDDLIFGEAGDDRLFGNAGDDQLLGGDGNDILAGGPGADSLFGGAGADIAFVAPGHDTATFQDFERGLDRLQIAPAFGFTDAAAILGTLTKPFSNVSRLNLDADTTFDIRHDSQPGTPLTGADIFIAPLEDDGTAPATPLPAAPLPEAINLALILRANSPEVLDIPGGVFLDTLGATAGRTVNLGEGAAVRGLDAGTTVNLDIPAEAATLVRNGTTLEVRDSDGNLRASVAVGTAEGEIRFTDAGGALRVDDGAIGFGGTRLTEDGESRAGTDLTLDAALAAAFDSGEGTDPAPMTTNAGFILRDTSPDAVRVPTGFNAEILGATGDRIVTIADGAAATGLDAGTRVQVEALSDGFTFARNGTTLEARDDSGLTVLRLAAGADNGVVQFQDLGGTLRVEDGTLFFGGEAFADTDTRATDALDLTPTLSIASQPAAEAELFI